MDVPTEKEQIASLEILVTALIRTLNMSPDFAATFRHHVDELLDAFESSPQDRHSQYSNQERINVSAETSTLINLQLRDR
ncbi:hypothetical protein [Burkholderia cepacia]|uniref:hypothetical protein n=1 Tax=Burkholderia cepacia TaxID=292 RepID=UPI00075E348B|nr:hypothetical protein [Burkholderia cepacia]KWC82748.1 hypothetical protein WL58_17915 [Burkholderia cepacia]KWH57867.1 hypothetical protein WM00_10295 [Burkholderia cepacia]